MTTLVLLILSFLGYYRQVLERFHDNPCIAHPSFLGYNRQVLERFHDNPCIAHPS